MNARMCPAKIVATLAAGLAVFLGPLCAPSLAQGSPAPGSAEFPFDEWLAAGDREEIPWKVRVFPEILSFEQRLLVGIEVQVTGKSLATRGASNDLILFARITDSAGKVFQDFGRIPLQADDKVPPKSVLTFTGGALLLPGDYRAVVVLYDRVKRLRSMATRAVHVSPLRADPLPDSWRDLPTVEFHRPKEGLDLEFHPEIQGRLWLPVKSSHPVQVELLVNYGLPETFVRSQRTRAAIQRALLGTFKALSQLSVPEDALHVTAFDLAHHKVLFDQEHVAHLDWPGLRDALSASRSGVIPVQELKDRKLGAAFLRQFLSQRFAGPALEAPPASVAAGPLRIFILLSSTILFEYGTHVTPMEPVQDCRCRIYYLQYQHAPWFAFDDLNHVLKTMHPRVFTVSSPQEVRKAIAQILQEISRQ